MNKERELEIIEMQEGGLSIQGIAEEFDISATAVRNVLKKYSRPTKAIKEPINEDEIVQQYLSHVPVPQILKDGNINYSQLYNILHVRDIPTRKATVIKTQNIRLDRAVEMYQEGSLLWEIKEETGIAQPTLHAELHKRSIPLRRQFTRPVDSSLEVSDGSR